MGPQPEAFHDEVTVTATPGRADALEDVAQRVNVIGEEEIALRVKTVLAQAASEEVGLHLQRTSPTIAGVFVRGLTDTTVNVYLDGVRYTTSAQRGGISTFSCPRARSSASGSRTPPSASTAARSRPTGDHAHRTARGQLHPWPAGRRQALRSAAGRRRQPRGLGSRREAFRAHRPPAGAHRGGRCRLPLRRTRSSPSGGSCRTLSRGARRGGLIRFTVGVADAVPKLVAYRLLLPALSLPEPVHVVCREDKPDRLLAEHRASTPTS